MTRYIDVFWEKLKQQTKKRRRAISIMLVLSLAVSSTVIWSLHGTGITMVNEELCGLELHSHTDECYSDVLVCGLDEADGHTHTAECYERQLTCTLPEHIHTSDCYIGMKPDQSAKSAEEPLEEAEAIGAEIVGDENIMKMSSETKDADGDGKLSDDEEIVDADMSEFAMSPDTVQLLATPPVLDNLPDTRNDGIVINLFDYGTAVLDTDQNSYNNPKYEGINAGRDIDEDILFFPFGTPGNPNTNPGMNNYSGDYNSNSFISGNRPVQGIVKNTLNSAGYPEISVSGHSLEYLFSPESNGDVKKVYKNVSKLLQKEDGYYKYDSNLNYAYYDTAQGDNGDFTIYNGTFNVKDSDMKIGFFPFNKYDETKNEPNFDAKNPYYNHHFGMTLEAEFELPDGQYNGDNIIFEYSGDDDMWVFVDGVLVLDVGGIHEPAAGKINFTTGEVLVQDEAKGTYSSEGKKWIRNELKDFFVENRWNPAQKHRIKIFYLERGGCYSNLKMEFNIPLIRTVTVSKDVDNGTGYTKDYDDQTYYFQLYSDNDELYTGSYEYKGDHLYLGADGIFSMKQNESISFHELDKDKTYYVKEVGIDTSVYSDVIIDGDFAEIKNSEEIGFYASSVPQPLVKSLNYDFINKVAEKKININVTKQWVENTTQTHSNDKVLFRIIRTDENGTKKEMVINGRKTFVLNQDNNWSMSFNNMVTLYGSHTYSYEVKEVSVHDGYVASYQTNTLSDGTVQYIIKNVSTSKVEINVKKQWLDAFGNELTEHPDSIKAKLERDYVEYGNPQSASLTVNVFNGDDTVPLISKSTSAVYVNGSIEFGVNISEALKLSSMESTDCTITESDGVFEVSDIKDGAVVDLRYEISSDIKTYEHIYHQTAEDEVNEGYSDKGYSTPVYDDEGSHWTGQWKNEGSNSSVYTVYKVPVSYENGNEVLTDGYAFLLHKNGNDAGLSYKLNSSDYQAGSAYGFSIYVISRKGRDYELQLSYTDKNNNVQNRVIASAKNGANNVNPCQWVHLSNPNYVIPAECDTSKEMKVIITTTNDSGDFYVGDFFIVNGGYDTIGVDENAMGNGVITASFSSETLRNQLNSDVIAHIYHKAAEGEVNTGSRSISGIGTPVYEDEKSHWTGEWKIEKETANNPSSYAVYKVPESYKDGKEVLTNGYAVMLHKDNGTETGLSYTLNSNDFQAGSAYGFSIYVISRNGRDYKLQLSYTDKSNNVQTKDIAVANNKDSNAYPCQWIHLSNPNYVIPAECDTSKEMKVIIRTTRDQGDFYVGDFFIVRGSYDTIDVDKNAEGNGNIITSPAMALPINFFEDTAIAKLIEIKSGSETVTNEFILNEKNNWSMRWTTSQLNEASNCKYVYKVTEITDNFEYLVTYENNEVSSNTADTPIIIKNTENMYVLPATGGIGTKRIVFSGTFLILISLLSGYCVAKRERREK